MGGAGARHDGDDLRLARSAHHAGLPRHVQRRATRRRGGASSTSCIAQSDAKIGMQLGHAGAKGSTQRGVGRHRPAARRRQLADSFRRRRSSICAASVSGRARRRVDDMDAIEAQFVRATELRRRGRLRLARTALRARLSAVELPVAADQPSQRRIRRLARKPPALSAGSVPGDARGLARTTSRCPCAFPRTTGSTGGITPDDAVEIARAFKAAGADLIDVSSGQVSKRREARLRPHVPDAVRRPRPQRGRHRDDRRRRDLRGRPRQQHHRGGPRRPVRASRGRIWPTRLGRCNEAAQIGYFDVAWPKQYSRGEAATRTQLT